MSCACRSGDARSHFVTTRGFAHKAHEPTALVRDINLIHGRQDVRTLDSEQVLVWVLVRTGCDLY